jgi:hypothetical protein
MMQPTRIEGVVNKLRLWDCVSERDIPYSVGVVVKPVKDGWATVKLWNGIIVYAHPSNFTRHFNWVDE